MYVARAHLLVSQTFDTTGDSSDFRALSIDWLLPQCDGTTPYRSTRNPRPGFLGFCLVLVDMIFHVCTKLVTSLPSGVCAVAK